MTLGKELRSLHIPDGYFTAGSHTQLPKYFENEYYSCPEDNLPI